MLRSTKAHILEQLSQFWQGSDWGKLRVFGDILWLFGIRKSVSVVSLEGLVVCDSN